ncbi:phage holin family protein [Photobacterium leiognathi]|uniref:phage holin family protein n=1 Tax=Photobacterium leiognathi TaxID=553611 RepID=UPI0027395964|nr:phage holin family protein [Photobacterium leiognathi]
MPEKDPGNYTLLTYAVFIFAAVWGGIATHISYIRQHNRPFVFTEALLQMIVSGFAGMLVSFLCWHMSAPVPLAGFLTGMAGFMGTRALHLLERKFTKHLGS